MAGNIPSIVENYEEKLFPPSRKVAKKEILRNLKNKLIMNAQQIENQEIWKQVKGSEKLFEIYTYFPTLHDGKIKNINMNYEEKSFSLTVDYSDLINKSDKSVRTRFTICWRNVQKADFNWYSEDLGGMEFTRVGDFIKTTLENSPFDFEGELISSEMEITNVEIETQKDVNNRGIIKFSIN